MSFPTINHINDILPFIKHKEEFIIKETDEGYQWIDYVVTKPDTFLNESGSLCSYSLECRGIKFNLDGSILARPFHKFFNIGEPCGYDWNDLEDKDYHIYEKLDGSMVHGCILDNNMRLMARKGITETSLLAESYLPTLTKKFALKWALKGYTPIFEFTSPDNRIVIKYDIPEFTLIGMRHNITGEYLHFTQELVYEVCCVYDIRIPPQYTHGVLEDVKLWANKEGVVIVFPDGNRAKLKADDYVLKHKCKEGLTFEKNVIRLVLENKVDDVLPILDEEDRDRLLWYQTSLINKIKEIDRACYNLCYHLQDLTQKEFALKIKDDTSIRKTLLFKQRNQGMSDVRELILEKHLTSQTKVDILCEELGIPRWHN